MIKVFLQSAKKLKEMFYSQLKYGQREINWTLLNNITYCANYEGLQKNLRKATRGVALGMVLTEKLASEP